MKIFAMFFSLVLAALMNMQTRRKITGCLEITHHCTLMVINKEKKSRANKKLHPWKTDEDLQAKAIKLDS